MANLGGNVEDYRGYTIQADGHGFYSVFDPYRKLIGSSEGAVVARDIVDEHVAKVFRVYESVQHLTPLHIRAAGKLNITQAEFLIEHGYLPTQNVACRACGNPTGACDVPGACG